MARTRDIEDVLSAVRRLVANDGPADRPASTAPTLLLSAAQRVDGPKEPFGPMHARAHQDRNGTEPMSAPSGAKDEGGLEPEADPEDEPFDIWARAAEDLDLPHDYAEDADFEEVESRADAADRLPAGAVRSAVPSTLADLSTNLVDEDQLRDMIADVVRKELSGELGERITRNVRKLVRREIRQILASDDLD